MVGGGHNHQQHGGSGGTFDVVLQRDAVTKPWGFRLQGGRESQQPLTIQRVFVGSASDGRLQRGDIITAVEGHDAFRMYHHDAESIIQNARNMLTLTVQRGSAISYAESAASDPGYYKASGTWPSGGGADRDEVEDYSRTVSDIRQRFNSPPAKASQKAGVIHMNPKPGMPSYVPKRPAMWTKKEPMAGTLGEMGWAPHLTPSRQQSAPSARGSRQQYPGGVYYGGQTTPVNRAPRHMTPPSAPASKEHHEPPAWAGSLRRSGGVRMWELEDGEMLAKGGAPVGGRRHSPPRATGFVPHPAPNQGGDHVVTPHNPRLQTVRYGPGSSGPTYEQHDATNRSDSANVAHLQYNSPIGLYSRQNAQEALSAQTQGKAGQGTLQISGGGGGVPPFNPTQSDVFRMVAEEDEHRAMRQHGPAKVANNARQKQQQRHHADGHQQHPPQHQQPYGGVESQFADMGISDF